MGVKPEVYSTGTAFKYCWVHFDTDLLYGVGFEGRDATMSLFGNHKFDILINGIRINDFKHADFLHYAPARGSFNNSLNIEDYAKAIQKASEAQKERDVPAVIFAFIEDKRGVKAADQFVRILAEEGVSVFEREKGRDYPYIIADASNISWFAYNQ